MPAPVLVVHDEPPICAAVLAALNGAAIEAMSFHDPLAALDAIVADSRVRILVTRANFGKDRLNGIALARMLLVKRPKVQTVIVGEAEYEAFMLEEASFLPTPLDPAALVALVQRLLAKPD